MGASKTRMGARVADGYNAPMRIEQWEQSGMSWEALGGRLLAAASKPRTARVINAGAAVAVAAFLASWTWGALSPPVQSAAPQVTVEHSTQAPLSVLLRSHLFGRSTTTTLASIPVSHLALTLSGLVTGKPGVALIGKPGKGVRPYIVGAAISSGVVLAAVAPDRAILKQNGRLQSLLLYPPSSSGVGSPSSAATQVPAAPPAPVQRPNMGTRHSVTVPVEPSVVAAFGSVSNATLKSWLTPGPAGGVLVKQAPGPAFASLGLRKGDIIEEVNGRPVNSLGAAVSAYMAGAKNGDVTVDVARDGHMKAFTYKMQGP